MSRGQGRDSLGLHREERDFAAEAELAWIRAQLPPRWKAGWGMSRACYALLASQCGIPQRGTLQSGTWYKSCFSQDCGTSEQVKQEMEEAEQVLPFNGLHS